MTEDSRSQVAALLELQNYDDALPILGELKERDPADRELQMYHLLVVRILILRWNLSRAAGKRAVPSRAKAERIIGRMVSLIRVGLETKVIPSLGRVYEIAGIGIVPRGVKRIITAAAGIALLMTILMFHTHVGGTVAVPAPGKMETAILALGSTVSASDTKPYVLDNFRTAEEAGRLTPRLAKVGDVKLLSGPHNISREVATTGHVKYANEQEAAILRTQPEKVIPSPIISGGFTDGQKAKQSGHIERPIELTGIANNRDKTPRKSLGYYRSGRAIPIRTLPRFAAATVREIDSGVSLDVVAFIDSWAEVELKSAGITGFVRREFLIPVEANKLHITQSPLSLKAVSDVAGLAFGSASE